MKFTPRLLAVVCATLAATSVSANDNDKLKVMTRNLYLGADIFPVIEVANTQPALVPMAVSAAFQQMQQTNFRARVQAIADEIHRYKPHAIGLQEVSSVYTQHPSDFGYSQAGYPEHAADTLYVDYLSELLSALESRGLNYRVAVTSTNADIELPMVVGGTPEAPQLDDLRLVDHDVILVRADVQESNPLANNFTYNVSMQIAGTTLAFTRGYTAVDIDVKGEQYRLVNTHLETGGSEPFMSLQAVQMNELLSVMQMTNPGSFPTVLMGDFNSAPTEQPFVSASGIPGLDGLPLYPPYLQAVGTGYQDLWIVQGKHKPGFTCCFNADVNDPDAQLSERIDHLFVNPQSRELHKVKVKVVGDDAVDMTMNGLWPSDHAGVVGKINFAE
ncbi:MAG: endonuclease/exonuclease/phosphatase family protein [Hahellaceae bacterium]|nr:endonuclease/exonuclease/phosphatase family protein [Hahellaceae bacterium]MCP5168266.1 endonuclease/exonuclease/phosphatase family protein [Hahellaceae bacterium]